MVDRELLQAALVGSEHTRAKLQARIAEIQRELAGREDKPRTERKPAQRVLSDEGKARIAEATRKRWAAYRVVRDIKSK